MIEIELPALKAYASSPTTLNDFPCYALRTPAGIWKYLNRDKQADGARTIPHSESAIAEALYQHFTAPSAAGRVLGLPDGSLFTSLGEGKWTLHNPGLGRTVAHLSDYEAQYLTDIANALGEGVLLANAVELEQRLRQTQTLLAERNAQTAHQARDYCDLLEAWREILPAVPKDSTAEELLAETELRVTGFRDHVEGLMDRDPQFVPLLIRTIKGSRAYVRAAEDSEAIVDQMVLRLKSNAETMEAAHDQIAALQKGKANDLNAMSALAHRLRVANDSLRAQQAKLWPVRIVWGLIGATALTVAQVLWGAP